MSPLCQFLNGLFSVHCRETISTNSQDICTWDIYLGVAYMSDMPVILHLNLLYCPIIVLISFTASPLKHTSAYFETLAVINWHALELFGNGSGFAYTTNIMSQTK